MTLLPMRKEIKAFVSANCWSYIINQNGNAKRITLYGYGSCTPVEGLDNWLSKLPYKEIEKLSEECDRAKDNLD